MSAESDPVVFSSVAEVTSLEDSFTDDFEDGSLLSFFPQEVQTDVSTSAAAGTAIILFIFIDILLFPALCLREQPFVFYHGI